MEEKFVDIKGFEGVYRIGDKGTLLSCKKHGKFTGEKTEWHPLSNVNKKGGYFSVVLEYDGKTKYCRIHRLVYEHFVGKLPRGCKWVVHHINGNKQDNRVENLELLSALEHSHRHFGIEGTEVRRVITTKTRISKSGKIRKRNETYENVGGKRVYVRKEYMPDITWEKTYSAMNYYNQHIKPKRIIQKDLDGNFIAIYENATEAGRATGVCVRNILQVANGEEFAKGHIRKTAGGYKWEAQSRS